MAFANLTSVLKKWVPRPPGIRKPKCTNQKQKVNHPPPPKKTRVQQMKQITLTVYPQSVSM